jgi:hypothetical protein
MSAAQVLGLLLFGAVASFAQNTVNLTAGPSNAPLPDGSNVPMWGYQCGAVAGTGVSCLASNPAVTSLNNTTVWSPVVITVPIAASGATSLTISLTNHLPVPPGAAAGIPTSLTIVGQLGGGLGDVTQRTTTPSPTHPSQVVTWATVGTNTAFTPPTQGDRVQSFGTEVATGATTALTWSNLRPGTYLIESGTHPSIQGPMGLYGILVVTTPVNGSTAGTAYPAVAATVPPTVAAVPAINYNAEIPVVFSEIDPAQNNAVNTAVNTAGFSETMVWSGQPGGCGNPSSAVGVVNTCYPPAVNYSPTYFMINGVAFNSNNVAGSVFPTIPATGVAATGQVLVRMVNAGLRMHVPSIYGSTTPGQTPAGAAAATTGGFALIAEDGNVLPGVENSTVAATATPQFLRIQTDVFMASGKTMDVMINVPAATAPALPIYDRELSLSSDKVNRNQGMLAYIGVNSAAPAAGTGVLNPVANPITYSSLVKGQTFTVSDASKGVISVDQNVFGVRLLSQAGSGTVTLNFDGTFTYVPTGTPASDSFTYCANGTVTGTTCSTGVTATVSLNGATIENASGIKAFGRIYKANVANFIAIKSPGVLGTAYDLSATPAADSDGAGYPLTAAKFTAGSGLTLVSSDSEGGFTATASGAGGACPTIAPTGATCNTFTYVAQNSQGTQSGAQTVTVIFPKGSGLQVTVLDGADKKTIIKDYRWVIEEDRTFFIDPTTIANTGGTSIVPTLGVNFHTSYMPYVAQGCTGKLSCEAGQMMVTAAGTHVAAVCDVGDGVCRPDTTGNGSTWTFPSSVVLDPHKRYYVSVLPGDSAGPFQTLIGGVPTGYAGAPVNCDTTPATNTPGTSNTCGHGMGGAPVMGPCVSSLTATTTACTTGTAPGFAPVTVLTQPAPYPPAKLSVFVFEDDFPLNGEHDGGGGTGPVNAANEPGLGQFQLHMWDAFGGNGDFTGQMTYDMFNQPLTNGLAGTIDPSTGFDACPMSTTLGSSRTGMIPDPNNPGSMIPDPTQNGITGMIVTCPEYESGADSTGNPVPSPLAGQAVIENLMPGRWGIIATPGADRIARGEEWHQTNTLDGQKAHDSFTRIGEPAYFQEFGPASFHVAIGFANPAIINARHAGVCAGTDPNLPAPTPLCNNTLTGRVVGERLSRTPDERLYPSGSHDTYFWTQCFVSFGDPDGEDFAFTKCDQDGRFQLTGLPDGDWRVTTFDQWNDQLVDGLSTPIRLSAGGSAKTTDMGDIATTQWQTNLYTKTFIDDSKTGVCSPKNACSPTSAGIPFANVAVRLRDGSIENLLVSDFTGTADFNETFPLFAWYTVETDVTRYKNTGTHVVYDAGGPADFSLDTCGGTAPGTGFPPCGKSTIGKFLADTIEQVSLPTTLRYPGAVYCVDADCSTHDTAATATTQSDIQLAGLGHNNSEGPSACTMNLAGATTCTATLSTGRIDPPWVGMEGWQGFPGQNNFLEFGKAPYFEGENGGIHGHVVYASTRPFDDPMMLVQTQWEPLVPNVTINLYQEGFAGDGVTPTLTLVDHTKTSSFDDWAQGFRADGVTPNMNCPGQFPAPTTGNGGDLFFFSLSGQPDYLDSYNAAHNGGTAHPLPNGSQFKCYDGMHNWNQIQPVPYDGAYAFPSVTSFDVNGRPNGTNCSICVPDPVPASGSVDADPLRSGLFMLPAGKYVVEVVLPPGFELVKEEDKNILIGDNYIAPVTQQFGGLGNVFIVPDQASVASSTTYSGPAYNANNPQNPTQSLGTSPSNNIVPGFIPEPTWPCVGEARVVPDYISLYPQTTQVSPFAGATRNLCDKKEVTLTDKMGAIAKFYIYTSTHIASKFTGGITDDYTSEFDPYSPQFGEKFAPPDLPVSIKDWAGNETNRVYADHWGSYDGLTYSTWEVNPPNPTGYAPTMMVFCMNDPGPIPVPGSTTGAMETDPLFTQGYSQFCYELPFMPGTTQYLDTPVVPTSAFAGAGYNNVDCSYPDATPAIAEVDTDAGVGPWVPLSREGSRNHTIIIKALGNVNVPNYAYAGPSATTAPFNTKTIQRHYGFGAQGTNSKVTVGGVPLTVTAWTDLQITATLPSQNNMPNCAVQQQRQYLTHPPSNPSGGDAPPMVHCGELVITANNGKQSIDTVTITQGGPTPTHVAASASVQAAIDAANPGDLIIIDPTCTQSVTSGANTTVTQIGCPSNPTAAAPRNTTYNYTNAAHNELLIMWKPVRLQGVGAATSIINANTHPAGKLDTWRQQVDCLFGLTMSGVAIGSPATAGAVNASTQYNTYDPTQTVSCPGAGWTNFNAYSETSSTQNPGSGIPAGSRYLNNAQVDRLPLEAVIGWSSELNGNLAELLQEPSLMGALEGAAITVLAKGVDMPSDQYDSTLLMGFPANTALLQGNTAECFTLNKLGQPTRNELYPNPFPSNYSCNPSSIDGLGLTDSSQGGGAIFIHGWGHNIQIANDRIFSNAGTLSGGINVGQGEYPPAYTQGGTTNAAPGSCLIDPTLPAGTVLPYCQNVNVNMHNNYIALNSSTGDELFSATPAGAGGVSICTGSDYYQFNYNFVCGNLSSGDGGGLGHLGFSWNGDIEHNTIVFNQSLNPTIPANGGGIVVMGTPDADIVCNGVALLDQDCVPAGAFGGASGNTPVAGVGPSDGAGPNLLINANKIMGNSAEAGDGGGIAFQHVNGSDVIAFPHNPENWNTVTMTNNIIADNVAGWDGAGVALYDSLAVDMINNTIANNSSTATAGILFTTLGAPLASQPPLLGAPPCTSNCGNHSAPQVAGVVAIQHSAVFAASITSPLTCPPNHPNCNSISFPNLENDIIYDNNSMYIGVGSTPATQFQQNIVTLFNMGGGAVGNQTATGACAAGSTYWDIGVRGDTGPADHSSGVTLSPSYSLLTSLLGGYSGNGNVAGNPAFVSPYCDGSRTPPETPGAAAAGWAVPPGIADATVPNPLFNITPVATVDEGNNWINLRWGPLSLTNPSITGGANNNYGGGALLGDYSLSSPSGSAAGNKIGCGGPNYTDAPAYDFNGNVRKAGCPEAIDIGAVEASATSNGAPEILSIDPNSAPFGAGNVNVNLSGTGFTGASCNGNTTGGVSFGGLTINTCTLVNDSSINANVAIPGTFTPGFTNSGLTATAPITAAKLASTKNGTVTVTNNVAGAPGAHSVTVTVRGLTSAPLTFTVTPNASNGAFTLTAAPTLALASGAGTFTITGGTCQTGTVVAPGNNCTINVRYVPPVRATPTLTNERSTMHITLTGTGFPTPTVTSPTIAAN